MGEHKRRYSARDGIVQHLITDSDHPGRLVMQSTMDVEPILDGIARDREIMRHGVNKHAARIPGFIYNDLKERGIADDEDAFRKWLNSSEAAPWRIWKGEI